MIEDGGTKLLFDTGANGDILLYNMKKLRIDPEDIDTVVLSHNHWDHVGGLEALLNIKPGLTIYRPTSSSKPQRIFKNFITTGALGEWSLKEHALICNIHKELILITGCSHPGLESIIDIAQQYGKIYALVGGFHGFDRYEMLQNIQLIVPCHCTQNKKRIAGLYPDTYSMCGVGKVIEI